MEPRRIFIGDVHGHYLGLMSLLELIDPGQADQIYFLGDLVDRGPNSSAVVELVKSRGYACLLGNHEDMMLAALASNSDPSSLLAWSSCGGEETLNSYRSNTQLEEHLAWMAELPLYLDLGDVWLVHAGVDPQLPLDVQGHYQFCWVRREFHASKEPYFPEKVIVVGHTITFTLPGITPGQVAAGAGWIDIDTGAYHRRSGWLTALDWTEQQIYQCHVFSGETRSLPLREIIAPIDMDAIGVKR